MLDLIASVLAIGHLHGDFGRDVVQYSERCECVMTKVVRIMTHGFLVRGWAKWRDFAY